MRAKSPFPHQNFSRILFYIYKIYHHPPSQLIPLLMMRKKSLKNIKFHPLKYNFVTLISCYYYFYYFTSSNTHTHSIYYNTRKESSHRGFIPFPSMLLLLLLCHALVYNDLIQHKHFVSRSHFFSPLTNLTMGRKIVFTKNTHTHTNTWKRNKNIIKNCEYFSKPLL